ncbi:MAG: hypothetical protein V1878_01155 [bacterium]
MSESKVNDLVARFPVYDVLAFVSYDILFWDFDHLEQFRTELSKRIQYRLANLPLSTPPPKWNEDWIAHHQSRAEIGLGKRGKIASMELRFALLDSSHSWKQNELFKAANNAQVDKFCCHIGMFAAENEYKPQWKPGGITAEISCGPQNLFQYWTLSTKGDFYELESAYEEIEYSQSLLIGTRIERISEALLYCTRLFTGLGVPNTDLIHVGVRHKGIRGYELRSTPDRMFFPTDPAGENEVSTEIQASIADLQSRLWENVKDLSAPLFSAFNFTDFPDETYKKIVDNFVRG